MGISEREILRYHLLRQGLQKGIGEGARDHTKILHQRRHGMPVKELKKAIRLIL